MKGMKLKQNSVKFSKLKIGCPFESLYLENKKHFPLFDLG